MSIIQACLSGFSVKWCFDSIMLIDPLNEQEEPLSTYAVIYLTVMSIIAVVLVLNDKNAGQKNIRRLKDRTFLFVSVLGGSAAMLLTMLAVRHKTRHTKFMLGIPLIILAQIAILVFVFSLKLSVNHYSIASDKIDREISLALVSDLHSCDYGDGQRELILAIDTEQPNAVLLCGDIFDDDLPPENTVDFIKDVAGKYPCYYVSGNHEFWSGQADDFKTVLQSYNVKILEGTSKILEIGSERIRISGLDDPDTDRYPSRAMPYADQISRLKVDSADNELFTVLLSHRPERITELLPLNPELVLSGHAHGGQWRLPIFLENGLLSPNQGLFPNYTNGEYSFGETELIVSRGLAKESTRMVPRIFNRPEIVMINLN